MRLVVEGEETSSVKTATKVVPAKERKKQCLHVVGGYGKQDPEELSSVERYASDTKRWELLEDAAMNNKHDGLYRGGAGRAAVCDGWL